ncbi:hypothetical protein [Hyalangium versicolor]|uniref:hypothetical protein n=1 Tax=Hyalangium versicolor TaxID=2861190 RepID=UPI001CCBAC64|nr:hypothetical protein [Hyalangium versicolor]
MVRNPSSPLKASKAFRSLCLLMVGATLAVGCGGVEPESLDDSQPVDSSSPQQPPEDGNVSAESACCYVKCYDNAGNIWRGPFRSVVYNNCANYGEYYCHQHHWNYYGAKWGSC